MSDDENYKPNKDGDFDADNDEEEVEDFDADYLPSHSSEMMGDSLSHKIADLI